MNNQQNSKLNLHNTIASRIKQRLIDLDMQQKDIIDALEVPKSTVSEWVKKNEKRTPNTEYLIELAKYLNCSVDYLVGITDAPTPLINEEQKTLRLVCDYTGFNENTIKKLNEIYSLYKKAKKFKLNEYTPQILSPSIINSTLDWVIANSDNLHNLLTSCIFANGYVENFNIDSIDINDYFEIYKYNNEFNKLLINIYAINFMLQQSFIEYLKKEYNIDYLESKINEIEDQLSVYQRKAYTTLKKMEKPKGDKNE